MPYSKFNKKHSTISLKDRFLLLFRKRKSNVYSEEHGGNYVLVFTEYKETRGRLYILKQDILKVNK